MTWCCGYAAPSAQAVVQGGCLMLAIVVCAAAVVVITAAEGVGTDLTTHCADGQEAAGHLARAFGEMQVGLQLCREVEPEALKLTDCDGFLEDFDRTPQHADAELVRTLETRYTCGGLCTPAPPVFTAASL